jgi:hypothetical protein
MYELGIRHYSCDNVCQENYALHVSLCLWVEHSVATIGLL